MRSEHIATAVAAALLLAGCSSGVSTASRGLEEGSPSATISASSEASDATPVPTAPDATAPPPVPPPAAKMAMPGDSGRGFGPGECVAWVEFVQHVTLLGGGAIACGAVDGTMYYLSALPSGMTLHRRGVGQVGHPALYPVVRRNVCDTPRTNPLWLAQYC